MAQAVSNIPEQSLPTSGAGGSGWERNITTDWRQGSDGFYYRTVDGKADKTPYAYPFDSDGRAVNPETGEAYPDQGGRSGGGGGSAPLVSLGKKAATVAGPAAASKTSFWDKLFDVGATVAETYLGQKAINEATRAQTDAINKSIELQREIYTQNRQDQMPWLRTGQGAIGALSLGVLGVTPDSGGGSDSGGPTTTTGGAASEPGRLAQRNPNKPQDTTFVPETSYTGDTAVLRKAQPRAGTQPLSSAVTPSQPADATASSYVTMLAPDGKTARQVPAYQQSFYEQRGARVVSNG